MQVVLGWAAHTAQHSTPGAPCLSLTAGLGWAGLGWAGLGWAGLGWLDAAPTSPHQNHGLWWRGAAAVPQSLVTRQQEAAGEAGSVRCCAHCALCRPLWPGLNKTEQCGPAQAAAAGWAHTPHLARPDTAGVLGLVILQHSPAVTRHWPGDSANTRTGTRGHWSTSGPCHHKVASRHHQLLGQLAALVICRYVDM